MKLALLTLFWLLALAVLAGIFAYTEVVYFSPTGAFEAGLDVPLKPAVLAIACMLGIFSKTIYDELQRGNPDSSYRDLLSAGLSPRRVIGALIVCPVIILSFYSTLSNIGDNVMIALLSYQNGFFFQSVLSTKLGKVRSR